MAFRPPYSERFLIGVAATGTVQAGYTVPLGKRAILSCFTVVDASALGAGATAAIVRTGTPDFLVIGAATGAVGFIGEGLHLVFYEGETMAFYRAIGTFFYSAHGYLLDN